MKIADLQKEIHATAVEKGWYESDRSVGDYIALIHSELSEAFEEFRNGHDVAAIRIENGKPEGFAVELGDALIRILDTCEHYNIDIEEVLSTKMAYNRTRPHRHGGKVV